MLGLFILAVVTATAWWLALGVRVLMPWKNLGCLAVSLDNVYFYADCYIRPNFGAFIHTGYARYTINRYGIHRQY